MLIKISEENIVTVLDNNYNNEIDMHSTDINRYKKEISLFDLYDDILSICWWRMSSWLLANNKDYKWENEEGPFSSYSTFCKWLSDNKGIDKEKISEVTFILLKTQFIQFGKFNQFRWNNFYNSIIHLNAERYFGDIKGPNKTQIFYELFPSKYFCSPYNDPQKNTVDNLSNYIFSSNLEMMTYDIFSGVFQRNGFKLTSKILLEICGCLLNTFYMIKKTNVLNPIFDKQTYNKTIHFIENNLSTIFSTNNLFEYELDYIFDHMTTTEKIRFSNLFCMLFSSHFRDVLFEDFKTKEQVGQSKIQLLPFLESDLDNQFECQRYLKYCYDKYAIKGNTIFYIDEDVNIALLIGTYASCLTEISFVRCNTCGRYFIRNIKNNGQDQCRRCSLSTLLNENIVTLKSDAKKFRNNLDINTKRLNKDLKNQDSKLHLTLSLFNINSIIRNYQFLLAEYNNCINKAILNLSIKHIEKGYTKACNSPFKNIAIQASEDSWYLPISPHITAEYNYSFNEIYKKHLNRRSFLEPFKLLYDANFADSKPKTKQNSEKNKSILALRQMKYKFKVINSAFKKYDVDIQQLKTTQEEILKLMTTFCEEKKLPLEQNKIK